MKAMISSGTKNILAKAAPEGALHTGSGSFASGLSGAAGSSASGRADMPVCPHHEICGGCCYQGVPYEEQLKNKEGEVRGYFRDAGVTPGKFDPIEGCPMEYRYAYRNKMEYTFGDLVKDGPLQLGMHKKKQFMSVVTVDQCQLVDPDFNAILRYTLDFCKEKGYAKYHKKLHSGLLRNLLIRRGVRTHELLVSIVTSTESEFDAEGWKNGLLALPLNNKIVGISQTLNDVLADKVSCDKLNNLYGRDYYMEEIFGLKFQVNLFSFFQTNVEAVERLYREAIDLIDDFRGKRVFDLYCGTGTISQVMAKEADSVLGVEIVPESVEAARRNAQLNGLTNCEFVCGDVFKVLENRSDKPDVIVVDPPRAGMTPDAVNKIAAYGVPQIVYISCNPKTLARDLSGFKYLGYRTDYVKPFDNFPGTKHVETVALMSYNM